MNEETTVLQEQGLGFSHPQQPVFAGWSAPVGPGPRPHGVHRTTSSHRTTFQ